MTHFLRRQSGDLTISVWEGPGNLTVFSSAGDMEYQGLVVATNHVSAAVKGHNRRCTDGELDQVRAAFDMVDAEEDNHSPGVARHLFLPLHLPRGTVGVCECKTEETIVVEADGYRWSKAKS